MRSPERTDKRYGFRARPSYPNEQGKVVLRAIEHASVPAASRSALRAVAAIVVDEEVHELQLCQIGCNHGGSAGAESAHDGHGAGRCIGLGAVHAVGSSQQMLCSIGGRRTPGSIHFDAADLSSNGLRPLLRTWGAHSTPVDSAGLAEPRPIISGSALAICYASEKLEPDGNLGSVTGTYVSHAEGSGGAAGSPGVQHGS